MNGINNTLNQIYTAAQGKTEGFVGVDNRATAKPGSISGKPRYVVCLPNNDPNIRVENNQVRKTILEALDLASKSSETPALRKIREELLGPDNADKAKPVPPALAQRAIRVVRSQAKNVDILIDKAVTVAKVPDAARQIIQEVVGRHPDNRHVADFMDAYSNGRTNLDAFRCVCKLAAGTKTGDPIGQAYLRGFAGDIQIADPLPSEETAFAQGTEHRELEQAKIYGEERLGVTGLDDVGPFKAQAKQVPTIADNALDGQVLKNLGTGFKTELDRNPSGEGLEKLNTQALTVGKAAVRKLVALRTPLEYSELLKQSNVTLDEAHKDAFKEALLKWTQNKGGTAPVHDFEKKFAFFSRLPQTVRDLMTGPNVEGNKVTWIADLVESAYSLLTDSLATFKLCLDNMQNAGDATRMLTNLTAELTLCGGNSKAENLPKLTELANKGRMFLEKLKAGPDVKLDDYFKSEPQDDRANGFEGLLQGRVTVNDEQKKQLCLVFNKLPNDMRLLATSSEVSYSTNGVHDWLVEFVVSVANELATAEQPKIAFVDQPTGQADQWGQGFVVQGTYQLPVAVALAEFNPAQNIAPVQPNVQPEQTQQVNPQPPQNAQTVDVSEAAVTLWVAQQLDGAQLNELKPEDCRELRERATGGHVLTDAALVRERTGGFFGSQFGQHLIRETNTANTMVTNPNLSKLLKGMKAKDFAFVQGVAVQAPNSAPVTLSIFRKTTGEFELFCPGKGVYRGNGDEIANVLAKLVENCGRTVMSMGSAKPEIRDSAEKVDVPTIIGQGVQSLGNEDLGNARNRFFEDVMKHVPLGGTSGQYMPLLDAACKTMLDNMTQEDLAVDLAAANGLDLNGLEPNAKLLDDALKLRGITDESQRKQLNLLFRKLPKSMQRLMTDERNATCDVKGRIVRFVLEMAQGKIQGIEATIYDDDPSKWGSSFAVTQQTVDGKSSLFNFTNSTQAHSNGVCLAATSLWIKRFLDAGGTPLEQLGDANNPNKLSPTDCDNLQTHLERNWVGPKEPLKERILRGNGKTNPKLDEILKSLNTQNGFAIVAAGNGPAAHAMGIVRKEGKFYFFDPGHGCFEGNADEIPHLLASHLESWDSAAIYIGESNQFPTDLQPPPQPDNITNTNNNNNNNNNEDNVVNQ